MFKKDIIAQLRKRLPTTIAQEIVGVQPMTNQMSPVFTVKKGKVSFHNYIIVENQTECVLYDTLNALIMQLMLSQKSKCGY